MPTDLRCEAEVGFVDLAFEMAIVTGAPTGFLRLRLRVKDGDEEVGLISEGATDLVPGFVDTGVDRAAFRCGGVGILLAGRDTQSKTTTLQLAVEPLDAAAEIAGRWSHDGSADRVDWQPALWEQVESVFGAKP